jgi:transposase InsO family protein
MMLYYDSPSAGYWGVRKTLDLLHRHFDWDGIENDVKKYIATCPACQGKAVHRYEPYGKLSLLPISEYPFAEISLDWIIGLPESRQRNGERFDAILTVVDRLTKYALFIPTRSDTTAADFVELFFRHVECRFGTPRGIVSDRDSRITSGFWREVCAQILIKRRISTAYHPQTDGQSEALNRVVQDYLHVYTTDEPMPWANLLPLA